MAQNARCCAILLAASLVGNAGATEIVSQPFLGVERIYRTESSPRPLVINVAIIDLTAPGIEFEITPRAANYPGPIINGSPGETVRQTTRQFADTVGAQLAINGSFFASATQSGVNWANNLGLTVSKGDAYSPWEAPPNNDMNFDDGLNISQTNVATIVKMPSSIPTGFETTPSVPLYNALTGSQRLLHNGANVASLSAPSGDPGGLEPRAAAGVTADDRLVMMVVDGRQTGVSEGVTVVELANYMHDYGVTDAINFDGGGSSTMVANFYGDSLPSQLLNTPSDGAERAVGVNLAVFALPNVPEPASVFLMTLGGMVIGARRYRAPT